MVKTPRRWAPLQRAYDWVYARSRIRAHIRRLATPDEPLNVVAWKFDPAFTLPDGFRASTFRGLLQCEVVRAASETIVLFYWTSEAAYRAHQADLAHLFTGAKTPPWSGDLGTMKSRRLPAWPTSQGDAVLKAAALAGAVIALVTAWDTLFASPDLATPRLSEDAVVQQPFKIPVEVENLQPAESVRVEVDPTDFERLNGQHPSFWIRNQSALVAGGGKAEIDVEGRMNREGESTIEIPIAARAGWLRGPTRLRWTLHVHVWPRYREHPLVPASSPGASAPLLKTFNLMGQLDIGEVGPKGLRCAARGVDVPLADFVSAIPAENDRVTVAQSDPQLGQRVIKMEWLTGPLQKFTPHRIRVVLASATGLPWNDWIATAKRVSWKCEELQ